MMGGVPMSDASLEHTPDDPGKWFATTHWSVVMAAGATASPRAAEALEQLCRTYWYPLYAYVRRQGQGVEDARDLTQAFFAHFLARNQFRHADPERGKFRSFLLTSLKYFLAHEWERTRAAKRGGKHTFISTEVLDAESRYKQEPASDLTPDKVFEQRWALTLFQKALGRLRDEYTTEGKTQHFEELKNFLTEPPAEGAYAAVAARLGLSNNAVATAVRRLRQQYGELVREEIAHTVARPEEVQDELRYLIGLVSG